MARSRCGGIRIDIDGGAADDAFHHLQSDIADRQRLVDEVEFVPGRPALDIEVGAEAKRMDRRAHHVLDGADAGEIDDGDDLAGDIRKTVAGAFQHLRRSLDLVGKSRGEEVLDRRPALGRFEVALGHDPAVVADREDVARIVEMGAQAGQPFVPHQHQEMRLRQPFRLGRVEAGGAVLDGVAAVGQQRLAGLELGAAELFRGQAFDGVAVDPGDPGGEGCAGMRLLKGFPCPAPPLPNL